MKIQQRILMHLLLGVVMYVLVLTCTIPLTLEWILPKLNIIESTRELVIVLLFCVETLLMMAWIAWYIGSPLLVLLKWIEQLTSEDFTKFRGYEKIHNRKGHLKLRFRIYKEVILHLEDMRIKLMQAKVERGEVEQAKQDWIAGISHDLKTPLTYIKGYSALLLNPDYEWSAKEQHEFIKEIDSKGSHMEQLVGDLNLAMQIENANKIPVRKTTQNIVTFIQQIIADISNDQRAKRHTFEFQTSEDEYVSEFDTKLLKRALENIYMNAVIYNDESVCVITSLKEQNNKLILCIEDDGIGMDKEALQQVFYRYYRGTTTEHQSEGTGLGMAITKSLIEAHGGTIVVESEQNRGTRFTISLPI